MKKVIIYLIKSNIRSTTSSTVLLGFNQNSLEHLMSKKRRKNWDVLWMEDQAKEIDSVLLSMANLAIIPQSLNPSIRNASWSIKEKWKRNKQVLDICAAELETLYDVFQMESWNEADIEIRAKYLYNNAKLLWAIKWEQI